MTYDTMEEAIKNGSTRYWDHEQLSQGRSGGTQCPVCNKYTYPCRRRKNHIPTDLEDCETCEIKDPFRRMWHEINRHMNESERKMFNEWISEIKVLVGSIAYENYDKHHIGDRLNDLFAKVPFTSSGVEE